MDFLLHIHLLFCAWPKEHPFQILTSEPPMPTFRAHPWTESEFEEIFSDHTNHVWDRRCDLQTPEKNACSDHTIAKDQWWPCQIIEGKQRRSQSFANAKGITALSANGKTFISCAPNQRGHIVVRPEALLQNWWVEVGNTFVKDNVNFSLFCRINPAVERNGHIVQPAQSSSIGSWNQISIDDFQNLPKQVGPTYHTSPT